MAVLSLMAFLVLAGPLGPWAPPLDQAQYWLILNFLFVLVVEKWCTLWVMLEMALKGFLVSLLYGFFLAIGFGWLYPEYGLFNQYWSGHGELHTILVPLVSGLMIVLLSGLIWSILYNISISGYNENLSCPPLMRLCGWPDLTIDRGGQQLASALGIWVDLDVAERRRLARIESRLKHRQYFRLLREGLASFYRAAPRPTDRGPAGAAVPGAPAAPLDLSAQDPRAGAAEIVKRATFLVTLTLALAFLPVFPTAAAPLNSARIGWLVGLAAGFGLVAWLCKVLRKIARKTWPPIGATPSPCRVRRVLEKRFLLGPTGVSLLASTTIAGLLGAYLGDTVYGPFAEKGWWGWWTSGRFLPVLVIVLLYGGFVASLLLALSHSHQRPDLRFGTYLLGVLRIARPRPRPAPAGRGPTAYAAAAGRRAHEAEVAAVVANADADRADPDAADAARAAALADEAAADAARAEAVAAGRVGPEPDAPETGPGADTRISELAFGTARDSAIAFVVGFACSLLSSVGFGKGLGSTFSLASFVLFASLIVATAVWLIRGTLRVQIVGLLALLLISYLNGFNAYKLRFDGLGNYYSTGRIGPGSQPVRLAEVQDLQRDLLTAVGQTPCSGCATRVAAGNDPDPNCDRCETRDYWFRHRRDAFLDDREVLALWKAGTPPAFSDAFGSIAHRPDGMAALAPDLDRDEPKPKLVVVATSGGALRASIWTVHVLEQLREQLPEVIDRTRLITGASGGMVGAGFYVTVLGRGESGFLEPMPSDPAPGAEVRWEPRSPLDRRLAGDYWTPTLHQLVYGDLITLPWPFTVADDRGRVLEKTWIRAYPDLGRTFGDLRDGRDSATGRAVDRPAEARGELPSLVFTPTFVEDARRLYISNLDLGDLALNHGRYSPATTLEEFDPTDDTLPYYSRMGVQLFDLFPNVGATFRVSTAARMSATFPYISPAVSLPTSPPRSVVDAGYYDNYGIDLAVSWLERNRYWLERNTSGVVLLQVRAFTNEHHLRDLGGDRGDHALEQWLSGPLDRGISYLTSPLRGATQARYAVTSFRNDNAVSELKRRFTFDKLEESVGDARLAELLQRLEARRYGDKPWDSNDFERFAPLLEAYDHAQQFFRVITFSCADEATGDAPGLETMNWFVGPEEYGTIVDKWKSEENLRRLRYLTEDFGRVVLDDAPAPEDSPRVGFALDPHSPWRPARGFGFGNDMHVLHPSDGLIDGQQPRWTFNPAPEGVTEIWASWPGPFADLIAENHVTPRYHVSYAGGDHFDVRLRPAPQRAPGRDDRGWFQLELPPGVAPFAGKRLDVTLVGGEGAGWLVADAVALARPGAIETPELVADDALPERFQAPEGWAFVAEPGVARPRSYRSPFMPPTMSAPAEAPAKPGRHLLDRNPFSPPTVSVPAEAPPEPGRHHLDGAASGPARWVFENLAPGEYDVYATWPPDPTHDGAARYTISVPRSPDASKLEISPISQQERPATHRQGLLKLTATEPLVNGWRRLTDAGPVRCTTGRLIVELDRAADETFGQRRGRLVADAIALRRVSGLIPRPTSP